MFQETLIGELHLKIDMLYQLHNKLQTVAKIFFFLAFIFVLIITTVSIIHGQAENYIPAIIWLVILSIANLFFLPLANVSFDEYNLYIVKGFKKKQSHSLRNIEDIHVSVNGYFTTIKLVIEGETKIFRCFNKIESILKYNKVDPFNLYRGFRNSWSIIDEMKKYVQEKKKK